MRFIINQRLVKIAEEGLQDKSKEASFFLNHDVSSSYIIKSESATVYSKQEMYKKWVKDYQAHAVFP